MNKKKYLGHPEQMAGAEFFRRDGGAGDGMKVCRVRNGLGLECMITADRAADVTELTFLGQNMGYLSPCGHVTPNPAMPFLERFTAGFFTTCGLNNVGTPNVDNGEDLPLHGTISNTPCHSLFAETDDAGIHVKAVLYDGHPFGRNLKLEREYFFPADKNEFILTDTVTNLGSEEEPYEILYHCNMGYPLLDEDSILTIPSISVTPRNDHAATGLGNWSKVENPTPGYEEMCFFHEMEKAARVSLEQPKLGLGVALEYDSENLPFFTQWKMMRETMYVMGLEPGNCTPDGRAAMRKAGTLSFLNPGESKTHQVKFVFYRTK
ncbi:MAG: aldose 1-epimerase family protein [Clostridia bacterium]|nr:aldose 1-epimerase family protein [Clostridia bacterium]